MKKKSNWLFSLLEWIMYTAGLNVLFLLCCLPVVTIGASMTALFAGQRALIKKEPCFRAFFHTFRTSFWRATVAWLILLPIDTFLALHATQLFAHLSEGALPLFIFVAFCTLLALSITVTVFVFYSRFEVKLLQLLRYGAELAMSYPLSSAPIAVLMTLPIFLSLSPFLFGLFLILGVLWLFFYFSLVAFAAVWFMNIPFIRFAQQTLGMDTTQINNKEDTDNDY